MTIENPNKNQVSTETENTTDNLEKKLQKIETTTTQNPNILPNTADRMKKSPTFAEQAKNMIEKSVKNMIEKGEQLNDTPEGIAKAKMLISYNMLTYSESELEKKINEKLKIDKNNQNTNSILNSIREIGEKE